jgi:hypothetical protein
MHDVYIIESLSVPGHFYIGYTDNLRERVRKHQADVSSYTAKYRPWKLKSHIALETKEKPCDSNDTSNPAPVALSANVTLSESARSFLAGFLLAKATAGQVSPARPIAERARLPQEYPKKNATFYKNSDAESC